MKTKEIEEIWVEVDVRGKTYLASSLGRIKRPAQVTIYESVRGTITRPFKEKLCTGSISPTTGYLRLGFSHESSKQTISIHSIIARAFLGERPAGMVVNHKNGVKTDNRIENLEYCTPSENVQHAYDNGLNGKGVDHHSATLTEEKVSFIRNNLGKYSQREIAAMCGVGEWVVSNIKKGMTYSSEKKIEITESEFDELLNSSMFGNYPTAHADIKEKLFGVSP